MIRQFGSKIVLFVMLSSLLGSCSKEPNKEGCVGQSILVDPLGIFSETYPLLYNSFIALETNDSSLIQTVNKVHLIDSLIFILDQMQSQVLIFNADGRFRNKISRRGQGPEEYVDICDMYIDVLHRQLYVYDGRMGDLLCYNFDGKFIDRHRLCYGYGVDKDNGGHWIVNRGTSRKTGDEEDADNRLFIYNSGFQYDSEEVVFNPYLRGRRYSFTYDNCEFSKFQDTVSFLPVMENVVYKIVDGQVRPWYDIQFKGHEQEVLRHGMDKETTRRILSDIRKARVPGRISKFQRIDNHLLFTFNYEKLSEMSILCVL